MVPFLDRESGKKYPIKSNFNIYKKPFLYECWTVLWKAMKYLTRKLMVTERSVFWSINIPLELLLNACRCGRGSLWASRGVISSNFLIFSSFSWHKIYYLANCTIWRLATSSLTKVYFTIFHNVKFPVSILLKSIPDRYRNVSFFVVVVFLIISNTPPPRPWYHLFFYHIMWWNGCGVIWILNVRRISSYDCVENLRNCLDFYLSFIKPQTERNGV